MRRALPAVSVAIGLALTAPAGALETSLQYVLTLSGDVQRHQVQYDCQGQAAPIAVEYLNAVPNFLAIIPIDGKKLIFANVIAASGARYASGTYIWWTKGADASLYDVTEGADAAPVFTCLEHNDIP